MLLLHRALAAVGGATDFTPANLFAASETGAWYDPSDITTLWQDTAGTTPVTATGQSVARIDDKSGNGNHATQATSGNRPTWEQDGSGYYYLNFDGTNDQLEIATSTNVIAASTAVSVWVGGKWSGSGATSIGAYCMVGRSSRVHAILHNKDTPTNFIYTNAVDGSANCTAASQAVSANHVAYYGIQVSQKLVYRFNGSVISVTQSGTCVARDGQDGLIIGGRGGSDQMNGRLFGLILRGATSTSDEITNGETWMNTKTGAY